MEKTALRPPKREILSPLSRNQVLFSNGSIPTLISYCRFLLQSLIYTKIRYQIKHQHQTKILHNMHRQIPIIASSTTLTFLVSPSLLPLFPTPVPLPPSLSTARSFQSQSIGRKARPDTATVALPSKKNKKKKQKNNNPPHEESKNREAPQRML